MAVVCLKYIDLGTGAGQLNDSTLPSVYNANPPVNYTPTDAFVYGQLEGIDNALGALIGGGTVLSGIVNPTGVTTPDFVGQIYINTVTFTQWIASDGTNTGWKQQVNPAQSGAGTPLASVTPRHIGDTYIMTSDNSVWVSYGVLNTQWRNVSDAANESILEGVVTPYGAVAPTFVGQRYVDNVLGRVWIANGVTNTSWALVPKRVLGGLVLQEVNDIPDGTFNAIIGGGGPQSLTGSDYSTILGGNGGVILNSDRSIVLGGLSAGVLEADDAIAGGDNATATQDGSIVLGDAAKSYRGSGSETDGVALGPASKVYGTGGVALGGGESWGDNSLALGSGDVRSLGVKSVAVGAIDAGQGTEVAGQMAIGVGFGVQVHGDYSAGFGRNAKVGTIATKVVAITNVGPDVELVVTGEDLTSRVAPGDKIFIYALSGGGHDDTVNISLYSATIGAIAFALGDTTITVNALNVTLATAGRIAIQAQVTAALAVGRDVVVNTGANYSAVIGYGSEVEGPYQYAMGYQCNAGVTVANQGALAVGYQTKAFTDYSQAFGRNSQTRNKGELARASQQWSGIQWSQTRHVDLHRDVVVAAGTANMYTDAATGGTEEFATFTGHGYTIEALVQGIIDTGAGNRVVASWKLVAQFKNQSGTVSQVGVTSVLPVANDSPARFNITPVFAVTGSTIRIVVPDDGSALATVRWMASLDVVELGR